MRSYQNWTDQPLWLAEVMRMTKRQIGMCHHVSHRLVSDSVSERHIGEEGRKRFHFCLLLESWTTNIRRVMEGGGIFELMRLVSEALCPSRTDTLALYSQGDGIRRHYHLYFLKGLKEWVPTSVSSTEWRHSSQLLQETPQGIIVETGQTLPRYQICWHVHHSER